MQSRLTENELTILVDSIRSITSSLDPDEVLKKIMRNALKVIPASDAGYLLLYDEVSELLLVKAPIGFTDSIYNFKVKKGESITGKVFEDGIGRYFNSNEEMMGTMDDFQYLQSESADDYIVHNLHNLARNIDLRPDFP